MDEIALDAPYHTSTQAHDGLLWNDRNYNELRATDGADISSRSKHREYMRAHGLATADDYRETWRKEEQRRTEYRTTGKGGAVRAEDVARAMEQAQRKR